MQLRRGMFGVLRFPRPGRQWKRQVHAAEVLLHYDRCGGILTLHYYTELTADGDADLEKPLQLWTLLPEETDDKGNFCQTSLGHLSP